MKKLCILLVLTFLLAVPAMAAADVPHLVDEADLLTPSEEVRLEQELVQLSEKLGMDIVVVTTDDTGYKSTFAYADDFYDYGGYGEDGVLWLIDMDNRQSTFSTTGKGIDRLSSDDEDAIQDAVTPLLTDGRYADAVERFVDLCERYCGFNWLITGLICFAVGLVVALIATAVMKGELKSVRAKAGAFDYQTPGSLQLTESSDLFLYRNVSRIARPQNSGSGGGRTSSSGRSHGGGSRGF